MVATRLLNSKLFILVLLLGLNACATPYQPMGFSGGFQEMQLGPRQYQVTFRGNGYTSVETVKQYLLRRAAELTQWHRFTHFLIVQDDGVRTSTTQHTNSNSNTTGSATATAYGNGRYATGYAQGQSQTTSQSTTYEVSKHSNTVMIYMCWEQELMPEQKMYAFDARYLAPPPPPQPNQPSR